MSTDTYTNIKRSDVVNEMKKAYINYSMSVIVARALPDVRDGLKPVQRRILYVMKDMGLTPGASYKKSAKVVGDVMGKYHPHGDQAIYDTMVRLAQDFSLRYPLVDGQGNWGSIDGDGAAAMRYTECKLQKLSMELLDELNFNTVDFKPNYDGSESEPCILPTSLPNLLLNGGEGIAVGMATKIPPHNVTEVLKGLEITINKGKATPGTVDKDYAKQIKTQHDLTLLKKERFPTFASDVELDELFKEIPGPDFPTKGVIYDAKEIKNMYATGRGRVLMRGVARIDENKSGKFEIIISELPYQVNKARLVARIAELVKDKKIEGISDLRDESNKDGIRVVIEIKRDGKPKVILNNLFKFTELQKAFNTNLLCLVNGEPKVLGLKQVLEEFVKFRQEVTIRKNEYKLAISQERLHILEGLKIALDNLDEVIKTIRASKSSDDAKEQLIKKFKLSEIQATAILDMQLRRLAQLERQKIEDEFNELVRLVKSLIELLSDQDKVLQHIMDDLKIMQEKFKDKRWTKVIKGMIDEMSEDDLIAKEDVVVTLSEQGYIKRLKRDTYQTQNRGGKGKMGMEVREEDAVAHILSCSTHDFVMFFTNKGRVFETKVYDIPEFGRQAKGQSIVNVVNLEQGEKVTAMLTHNDGKFLDEDILQENEVKSEKQGKDYKYLFFATKFGTVKKTLLEDYNNIRQNGLIAIKLESNDELIWAKPTTGANTLMMVTKFGKSIHFKEKDVTPTGRSSMGVIGIRFAKGLEDDEVISMDVVRNTENMLLTITQSGFGKVTKLTEFATQNRGGSGVFAHEINKKTGNLVAARVMDHPEIDLLIMSEKGQTIRLKVSELPERNRQTQGVHLIKLNDDDKVSAIAFV